MVAHSSGGTRIHTQDQGEGVLLARIAGSELGLFGRDDARELFELVERAHRDPKIRAVVFTGSHPGRFVSHADLQWLQEDGAVIPPVSQRITSLVARLARLLNRSKIARRLLAKTPMTGALQLDQMHNTLLRMTTSPTIFVAAMNGSTLGVGAEIAWACDLRLMAEGEFFIGHLEVLLGFAPGAGGTQRLPRLIGSHRALVAILEGEPLTSREALRLGAIDEIVPADELISRSVKRAAHLSARPSQAIGAVKRAVNAAASLPMKQGLHIERAEFLASLPQENAQAIMLNYLSETAKYGELPIYRPGGYATALSKGDARRDSEQDA